MIGIAVLILSSIGYCEWTSTAQAHFARLIISPIPRSVENLSFREMGLAQDYSCSFYFTASNDDTEVIRKTWFTTELDPFMNEQLYRKQFGSIFQESGHPLPADGEALFYSATRENTWRAMLVTMRSNRVYMTYWEGH
jgi:hypothetical protein